MPRPKTLFAFFRESVGDGETDSVSVSTGTPAGLFAAGSPLTDMVLPMLKTLEPQRAKVLMQALTRLHLIHTEQVILMTPEDWLISYR